MTQPQQPPDRFTAADVAAALAAAQAAMAARDSVAASIIDLSTLVSSTRDVAAAYAKTLIWGLWASVDPYDGRAVQDFTAAAAAHMVTAQGTTARAAAAAQAGILRSMGVTVPGIASNPVDVRSPGADVVGERLVLRRPDAVAVEYATRRNATISAEDMTTQGMFNRPARTVRAMVAEGATLADADAEARKRIERLVDTNVMLAQRFAEAEVLQETVNLDRPAVEVIGYRRVLHPELSETGVCGLCIAAADQRYKVGTLLDIHDRCKCTIAAITEDHDPAADVNAADLGALYDAAGGTDRARLKRVRYQVDEHGELGPTLVPKKEYKPRPKKRQPAKKAAPAATPARVAERRPATVGGGGGGGGGEPPVPPLLGGPADDWSDDRLTPALRRHILDGDANGSGGHRHGTDIPGKTEFPEAWSDAQALRAVSATLDGFYASEEREHHTNLYGMVDGVRMLVRRYPDGTIATAHPLDGEGVVRNDRADGTKKRALPLGTVRNVPLPS